MSAGRRTAGVRAAEQPGLALPARRFGGGDGLAWRIPALVSVGTLFVAFHSCGPRSRAVRCVIFGLCVPLLGGGRTR